MNRHPIHTHCMTLRIEPSLDEALEEACCARRTTKAGLIRSLLRQSLGLAETLPHRMRKHAQNGSALKP
jgi:hypothetical protein